MTKINCEERHASHPNDVKQYDSARLRQHFLIEKVFGIDEISLTYSMYDRFIAGGAIPLKKELSLNTIDSLKSEHFCDRREVGIINIGGKGIITVDGNEYSLKNKEGIYIGMGAKNIILKSSTADDPAMFYINSAPAHQTFKTKKITLEDTIILDLGNSNDANERRIIQYIVAANTEMCQLQMGITELKPGSVWNTMPPHTHNRRMEVYLYTGLPEDQAISHFMGEPTETRHIWMTNNQAVISPPWSIHCASGTSNYSFVWGMAGENLDFTDMDGIKPTELR
ncbi:5-dehydro-4-deoxy-D-glucuronate isomerase [Zobellia galactanivorans]|uniref:5-dehydro-4-deoxy-D-glucuronate isomerase n=1 Tax=Zobellia galactanivorans (strain DSM 12802 / CCUG 47099 / CIP 106680 / NCIMB 13871 / Dsij) TaxID=63186 RepID=UPI0026E294A3|nr:5-dehydro-4-deoxy-D-glucuronate isomerase [Zobellia galactanivorans]MDO6809952.1 5-dehydro-4-deoxy-D-glucuronate isomerase [Zobellia galactanivorans]